MGRKIEAFEDLKKKYVRQALETNKISTTARQVGVNRETLSKWIKTYEDEVRDEMEAEASGSMSAHFLYEDDYKKKYEHALAIIGEKELEVALLRDALKKSP